MKRYFAYRYNDQICLLCEECHNQHKDYQKHLVLLGEVNMGIGCDHIKFCQCKPTKED